MRELDVRKYHISELVDYFFGYRAGVVDVYLGNERRIPTIKSPDRGVVLVQRGYRQGYDDALDGKGAASAYLQALSVCSLYREYGDEGRAQRHLRFADAQLFETVEPEEV